MGGIVALPFERLFGLAANASNHVAISRLASFKRADNSKPISVILPSMDALDRVAAVVPPIARDLQARFWPGPLTILLPARRDLHRSLVGPGGTVGVRLPSPCPALQLAAACDSVLTATSANRPGAPDPTSHEELEELEGVDLVVPGSVPGPPGSTVVGLDGDRVVVVREGAIPSGEFAP